MSSFWQRHNEACARVVAQTKDAFPEIYAIRSALLGVLDAELHNRTAGSFDYDLRHHLIAQFLQGICLSHAAIEKGIYAQAANLQKQQIETLTAIKECELNRRRDGRTPLVGNSMGNLKIEYDNLNDVAHPSKADVLYELSTYEKNTRMFVTAFPIFKHEISRAMLLNHCHYMFGLFISMTNLFDPNPPDELSDQEVLILDNWRKLKLLKA